MRTKEFRNLIIIFLASWMIIALLYHIGYGWGLSGIFESVLFGLERATAPTFLYLAWLFIRPRLRASEVEDQSNLESIEGVPGENQYGGGVETPESHPPVAAQPEELDLPVDYQIGDPTGTNASNTFRKQGAGWLVRYEGKDITVEDIIGTVFIAMLVESAGRSFSSVELNSIGSKGDVLDIVRADESTLPDTYEDVGLTERKAVDTSIPVVDEKWIEETKESLKVLIKQNEDETDTTIFNERKLEIQTFRELVSQAVDIRGRSRKTASESKKSTDNVRKAIRLSIKKITAHHPELGVHLSSSIEYTPAVIYSPKEPTVWEVDF